MGEARQASVGMVDVVVNVVCQVSSPKVFGSNERVNGFGESMRVDWQRRRRRAQGGRGSAGLLWWW